MNKKKKLITISVLSAIVLLPFLFDLLWAQDIFNLFPSLPESNGYVETSSTGFALGNNEIAIHVTSVDLHRDKKWEATCDFMIIQKEGSERFASVARARLGDQFSINGYHLRVIRIFPFSPAAYLSGYSRGVVTIEVH